MYEDWGLIEASFTAQYGIRLRNEDDMSWNEFSTLLAGIMPETPLGQVISIRSESDKDTLKNFNSAQHKMRNDWKNRQAKQIVTVSKAEEAKIKREIQNLFKQAFS